VAVDGSGAKSDAKFLHFVPCFILLYPVVENLTLANSNMRHLLQFVAADKRANIMVLLLVSCFVANAYTSESMPQQRSNAWTSYHVERPLAAPFPNGPCGGQVITLPRVDLFPGQEVSGNNPFFNLNQLNPFTSLVENVVLPPRDVKVWLPKEYHSSEYRHQRFPVLYCHDGQTGELSCA
jgi:hypothetical protein